VAANAITEAAVWIANGGAEIRYSKGRVHCGVQFLPANRACKYDDGEKAHLITDLDGEQWVAYQDGRVYNVVSLRLRSPCG
jgi:hypothetical protein